MRRAWAAVALALLIGGATPALSAQEPRVSPPGEGVICMWAIYSLVAEVGQRCTPEHRPEAQAELRRGVQRLEAYVRANSQITEEEIAEFKRQQAHVGAPEAELCHGDARRMFEGLTEVSLEDLRTSVDEMVARPGQPTWGTCL